MANNVEASSHGSPPEGMECLAMMEEIDASNYVEYQTFPSLRWRPALYCAEVVEHALANQYKTWMERMQTSDCAAEIKRLLDAGPPVWIADKHALPLADGETHVCKLWFMADDREVSAMLAGALDGADRQALWDELKMVHAATADGAEADAGAGGGAGRAEAPAPSEA